MVAVQRTWGKCMACSCHGDVSGDLCESTHSFHSESEDSRLFSASLPRTNNSRKESGPGMMHRARGI